VEELPNNLHKLVDSRHIIVHNITKSQDTKVFLCAFTEKEVKMECSSCGRDIRENVSYCSDCSKEVQGSGLNEQEMTQIWKELKDKRYEKIISYAFSTFFLFSGVVGVIKTSSSFPVWMVVASFIVSALLFISSARCGKRIKELKRKLERRV